MAYVYTAFTNTDPDDFVSAVNTALAALVAPTIRQIDFQIVDTPRRLSPQYNLFLTHQTAGTALGTPFQVRMFKAATPAGLITLLNAFTAANPAYWVSGVRMVKLDVDGQQVSWVGFVMVNPTVGAGAANFLPQ